MVLDQMVAAMAKLQKYSQIPQMQMLACRFILYI